MLWTLNIGLGIIALYAAYFLYTRTKGKYKNLIGKHVVITGGSSGIGKAAACEAARLGADVTIIGRDVSKLKLAVDEIMKYCSSKNGYQMVQFLALDVTSDYDIVETALSDLEPRIGPIFMLVNCAGACICGLFEEMKVEDIKQMIDLNYLGTAFPTRAVLSRMRKRNVGFVVFVSSEAALVGIYGYSAYSAGKWAVRGLAEAIGMELVGTNVKVMLSYPPDTDTPGLQQENTTKPEETKIISGTGGLHTPESVGRKMIHDALNGKSYSTYSFSGALMNILYGVSVESIGQIVTQVIFMGFLRIVMVGILASFNKVIKDQLKLKNSKTHARKASRSNQSTQAAQ